MIEVELKFPVRDILGVRDRLDRLGAVESKSGSQVDEYFDDPLRDFSALDCALRIRRCDSTFFLTFKGKNLDSKTKMRSEIEFQLGDELAACKLRQVFEAIGFCPVAKVSKRRQTMELLWESTSVTICLDHVEGLGDFVELEIVAQDAAAAELAKEQLLGLANELSLSGPITTSYLNLLMQEPSQVRNASSSQS
jgi:adenylate cyclase class 2